MTSHTHKHSLSGVARWTVPAALCSVGMMGAWLAPGASAMASTPAASTHAATPAVVGSWPGPAWPAAASITTGRSTKGDAGAAAGPERP